MSKFILLSSLLAISSLGFSQQEDWKLFPPTGNAETPQTKAPEGTVNVIQDPKIEALIDKSDAINEKKLTIDGYRVQIFFGSGANIREKATVMQSDFLKAYPNVPAYMIYEPPFFKVRVGDFRSRPDALKFLKEIGSTFPESFMVKDEINLPKLD